MLIKFNFSWLESIIVDVNAILSLTKNNQLIFDASISIPTLLRNEFELEKTLTQIVISHPNKTKHETFTNRYAQWTSFSRKGCSQVTIYVTMSLKFVRQIWRFHYGFDLLSWLPTCRQVFPFCFDSWKWGGQFYWKYLFNENHEIIFNTLIDHNEK